MGTAHGRQQFEHYYSMAGETINEGALDFRLHQIDLNSPVSNPATSQGSPGEFKDGYLKNRYPQDVRPVGEEVPRDPQLSNVPHVTTAQMIYADYPNDNREYGNPVSRDYFRDEESTAKEIYQEVLDAHEQVMNALDAHTDPNILSEKFIWGNQKNLGTPTLHRTLEIEVLNAMSRGDAHTAYELAAEIQKKFIQTDDSAQSERNLRYLSIQALAFFTQVLLNLGISVELAFFLLDFFNKQINALRSVNSLIAYHNHILQVYLYQVQKHRERNFSPPIQRAVNYVRQNTKDRLTLANIAKHAEVHPNYLSQKFSQEVGVTLSQFIGNERMSSIKSYLVETDIPLSEIAKRFNFSSNSYFSTYFRKHTNMSPSQYRKEHRKF